MYVQLVEDENWKSPLLYIHSDKDEALQFIEEWKQSVIKFSKESKLGTPLSRLDVNTAFCDLVFKVSAYYLETSGDTVKSQMFVQSWLRCFNESWVKNKDEIVIIKLKE